MILEHIGLSQINGSLVVLDDVKGVQYDEMVELHLDEAPPAWVVLSVWTATAALSRCSRGPAV